MKSDGRVFRGLWCALAVVVAVACAHRQTSIQSVVDDVARARAAGDQGKRFELIPPQAEVQALVGMSRREVVAQLGEPEVCGGMNGTNGAPCMRSPPGSWYFLLFGGAATAVLEGGHVLLLNFDTNERCATAKVAWVG